MTTTLLDNPFAATTADAPPPMATVAAAVPAATWREAVKATARTLPPRGAHQISRLNLATIAVDEAGQVRLGATDDTTLVVVQMPSMGTLRAGTITIPLRAALTASTGAVPTVPWDGLPTTSEFGPSFSDADHSAVRVPTTAAFWREVGLRVAPAMLATPVGRLPMTALLGVHGDGYVTVVTTDGHRLIEAKEVLGMSYGVRMPEMRLTRQAMLALADLTARLADDAIVHVVAAADGATEVQGPGWFVRVVAAPDAPTFPDYTRIVPTPSTWVWLRRRPWLDGLLAVMPDLTDVRRVRLVVRRGSVRAAILAEGGAVLREFGVPAVVQGPDTRVELAPRYLLDAVKTMKADGLALGLTSDTAPVLFYPVADDCWHRVFVMPMAPSVSLGTAPSPSADASASPAIEVA